MEEEDMVHTTMEFSLVIKQDKHVIYRKMDGSGDRHGKQKKPD
jgi:hypothetical protein